MAPRLRVFAGTSLETLHPITDTVNTNQSSKLISERFEGEVAINIKGFTCPDGQMKESEYFSREDKQGITWSLQVQGKFLQPCSADDILFGNTFERPLKLPWGSSAALKFMHYVDPTLEHDLTSSTKPWALSPLISTMPHFIHTRVPDNSINGSSDFLKPSAIPSRKSPPIVLPPFPSHSIEDDISQIHLALTGTISPSGSISSASSSSSSVSSVASATHSHSSATGSSKSKGGSVGSGKIKEAVKGVRRKRVKSSNSPLNLDGASQRRSYFSTSSHRQAIQFGPEDVITTDFCYGFLEFNPTLCLRLPGGISFDLMKYWDGQPVRFVCCERKHDDEGEDPWGAIFWCVSIEMEDDGLQQVE